MELIDTHCHIHFDSYGLESEQVLEAAKAAGVTKAICVGCSLEDSQLAVEFAAKHDNIWATVGAHPHDGADFLVTQDAQQSLKELLAQPKVVALGEIGLDYFHENSRKSDQEKALRMQIEVGLESGKPFVFHIRDAWEDFWDIYDNYRDIRGVIHSFSAHPKQLEQVLSRGLYVGLNGIMTFTKDEQQLEAAKAVPLDRMLIETDAPFLTPKPFRGQTCEPKHVRNVAEFLADLRGENLDQLAKKTTQNALALFELK